MDNMTYTTDAGRVSYLARAYLDADYRCELRGDWHVFHIGQTVPVIDDAQPGASCFGFLSAWNPWSQPRPDAVNRAADQALHDTLAADGYSVRPAFASAPNRAWREPSWVVADISPERLDALMRQFDQLGTLWWRRGGAVRLRLDAARPDGFDDGAHVDWLQALK
jgi:hypothetical protein